MLTGRNYSGGAPRDDALSFDDTAHMLAVGMTGSGKTGLAISLLFGLASSTLLTVLVIPAIYRVLRT